MMDLEQRKEAAARAGYAKAVEQAPKWNTPEEMARWAKPWDELAQDWRDDWIDCVWTAVVAACPELLTEPPDFPRKQPGGPS